MTAKKKKPAPKARAKAGAKAPRKPPPRRGYHHGNLRQALVDAAVALAGEGGVESVSVREAARRAGVSPGAPFRHFANRRALLTAVAEEAIGLFSAEIESGLRGLDEQPPLARFRALGAAFMRYALRNPTHFRIISARDLIDYEGSQILRESNDRARALAESLLGEAMRKGDIARADVKQLALMTRATVYGLARMAVDGQLPHWDVPLRDAEKACMAAMDLLIATLAHEP